MTQQGRPRALADNEKRRTVCAMISAGAGMEAAARHAGCSTLTIRREAQRDEAFARQLQDAQTAAELAPLRMIRQAGETQWRAAAWLLERTCPERFARRGPDTVAPEELKAVLDEAATILVNECYDEPQRERVVERLRQLQEDRFGERRARRQGAPEPKSKLDQLMERIQLDIDKGFCTRKESFDFKSS